MLEDQSKPFLDHLEDLRGVILRVIITLLISMVFCGVFIKQIIQILMLPLHTALEGTQYSAQTFLRTLGVIDPLTLTIQISLFSGAIVASPFILFFVGNYLLPALRQEERRMLLPAFASGTVLFLAGVAFCYWLVLPAALGFFIDFNNYLEWTPEWTVQNYLGFVLQMLFAFGVSFELPVLIIVLAKLGLVSGSFLSKHRKHAIVAILIFAAVITPTSDPYNLSMLFFPMYLLFEASLIITYWIEKKESQIS